MRVTFSNNKINIKNKTKKMLKYVIVMTIILNISMPCFFNIINAVIYPTYPEWPGKSEIGYNTADNSAAFPDSYKQYIKNLKEKHPNWIFKAVYTNLDWTNSINQESYDVKTGISTVPNSYPAAWKKDGVDIISDGTFVIASKEAVAYTMDPRNFLNENGIFQFEALDYSDEVNYSVALEKMLSTTLLNTYPTKYKKSGAMVDLIDIDTKLATTWSQIIINAAKNAGGKGISPIHLASRMIQETSSASARIDIINNLSINGSVPGYEGLYNFFNIGSTPNSDGSGSVTNGLIHAKNQIPSWTTPQLSINTGAKVLRSSYIQWGQNTIYFQKFDVSNIYGNAKLLYGSQYMTNILAPSSESKITYSAYSKAGLVDSSFVFYIPVYNNMPNILSVYPGTENTLSTIIGTDIIYLDATEDTGKDDVFYIRSSPEKIGLSIYDNPNNIISTIVESQEGAENRTKFTRIEVGTNGWDKIKLSDGTEGYISQTYTKDYVYTHVTGVALNKTVTNLKVGGTETLTATILPTNAYIKNLTWNSSNSSIATVDSSGKVTAKAVGTANIIATTLDGTKVATCVVTVEKTLASSITSNTEYPLVVGNYLQLAPTVLPATTTDKTYDIAIANSTIAIVESGKIKGLKAGNTTVTLTTKDGSSKTCTFNLKVTETVSTINNYTVDNNSIITKVTLGTTVSAVKGNVTTSYTKKLVNAAGTVLLDTDKVGTGTKVQILDGTNVLQEYKIVIYGDISGDGTIDVVDLLMLKRKLTNRLVLAEYPNKAANISKTGGEPDVTDLLRLKRHLTNKNLIVQ